MSGERLTNKYISAFVILIIGMILFIGLREFFSSFLGAVVFYTLFRNFMCYLTKKRKLKKPVAAVIIIIISFIIVVLPVGLLFTIIFNKITALVQDPTTVTAYAEKIMD